MDEKIGTKLDEELIRIEDKMKTMTPGTKEYAEVANAFRTLHQTRIDSTKAEAECDDKCERRAYENGRADEDLRIREHEQALKREQFDDQKKDRWIRVIVAGVELIVPLAFYGIWMAMGFKFESEGTFTSSTFRNFWSRLKPLKK